MYFKQVDEIIAELKTHTRRVAKQNEIARYLPDGSIDAVFSVGKNGRERLKWQVGRDYAVSPGRGKFGLWWSPALRKIWDETGTLRYEASEWHLRDIGLIPLRICITEIRREPLNVISIDDAIAEGCPAKWAAHAGDTPIEWYRQLWESINGKGSWSNNPDVWVLMFKVAE